VDAGKRDGQHRVPERPELDRPGTPLAQAPRDGQAARSASERENALGRPAFVAAPDEDSRGPKLEPAQTPNLHLERPLGAADLRRPGAFLLLVHATEDSLRSLRKHVRLALLVALLAALAAAAAAASPPPQVAARAVLVADGRTGDVLYRRGADERMPMASITKLMTAIVTLEHARPGESVTVSRQAVGQGGSSIFLSPGERLRLRDLLAAALIQSANDSAYALAAEVGDGSIRRFVRMMNAKAAELGLDGTNYVRPDGLDAAGHLSTARDTFRLAQVAMEEPLIRELVRTRTTEIAGGRKLRSWNDLLWTYPGLIGVKTGHTDRAGWSEVAAARRKPTTVYAVILGSPSRARRNADLTKLLDWGFEQYARFPLVREGRRYATASVPFAEDERLALVAADDASRIVRLGDRTRFVEQVVAPAMVDLPVRRGQKLGEVIVTDGEREVARVDLVAARDVPAPSLQERVGWYADRAVDEAGDLLASVIPGL
jgi:serine-type D-Ala-D-Ala carboxypeptidase (penicillin-binding protein 5/6)